MVQIKQVTCIGRVMRKISNERGWEKEREEGDWNVDIRDLTIVFSSLFAGLAYEITDETISMDQQVTFQVSRSFNSRKVMDEPFR